MTDYYKDEIRKEFCPNCEAETPCTHEAELFVCDICGEDFAKYIVPRKCNVSDVSMTQDVLIDIKTPQTIENTNPDYYKQELSRRDEIIARLKEDLAETQACLLERNIQLDVERRSHRWIPVSERLPNRDGFYLILENVNQVAGYYHWCKQFGWNTDGGRIHIQTVTHWMPLPPPPEEK